ncbi:MAG: hypothetical protein HY683_04645 [Chloroflexi bacterium]|nr:hypothetical protein [Chloroflexota bacterium]
MGQATFVYDEVLAQHVLREDHVLVPARLRDAHRPTIDSRAQHQAAAYARESVAQVKRLVFPLHNLAAEN